MSGLWRRFDRWVTGPVLSAFNSWFCSAAGVLQTAVVVVAIMVLELTHPRLDPHGFWMLYLLTVYSGITQPALAYAGQQGARQMEALEERVAELEATNGALLIAIAQKVGAEVQT